MSIFQLFSHCFGIAALDCQRSATPHGGTLTDNSRGTLRDESSASIRGQDHHGTKAAAAALFRAERHASMSRLAPPPPPFGALLQQALLEGREVAKAPFSGGGGAALRSPLDWLPRLGHLGPEIHHGGE